MASSAEKLNGGWQSCIVGREEQREAITSQAVLTVVSAGAGTGKTHTLAQRFAWLLSRDTNCTVEQILVLTFTEKAAREMRERIKKTVESWYKEYPQELAHLRRSVKFMEEASISTIHSFAMKVIRESALVLDVDPTSGIIAAPREELWWERYAKALAETLPQPLLSLLDAKWRERAVEFFADPLFADFVSEYGAARLSAAAKLSSEALGSAGKGCEELWGWPDDNITADVSSLSAFPRQIWQLWTERVAPRFTAEMRSDPGKSFQNLMELLDDYAGQEPDDGGCADFCARLFAEGLARPPGKSRIKSEIEDELGEKLTEWRDREGRLFQKSRPPSDEERVSARLLRQSCALGWRCWDALHQQQGAFSMDDLIRYAGEALDKMPGYGEKFRHILVDEFQDTDGLQDKLLTSLWGEERNTLFVVGDLKQSIYRFRHADLLIFQSYIEKARRGGRYKYVTLDRSYRTRGALLADFNDIFSGLWRDGLKKGSSMRYEPLLGPEDETWWKERNEERCGPRSELLLSLSGAVPQEQLADGEKDGTREAQLRLFGELARRIAGICRGGGEVWEGQAFRRARWSDFALLAPTRTVYPLVERALGEAAVPYVICTGKSYFSRGEVADIVNLAVLLADPENPLFLMGWLSSPLSGVTPQEAEECAAAALCPKHGLAFLADAVRSRLPLVWDELLRLRKLALFRGTSEAILALSVRPFFLNFYDPRQRRGVMANLMMMAAIAEEYECSEGASPAAFADYLRLLTLGERQKEEPDVVGEEEDAVRVMTIHSSKGLEYPAVAVLCGDKRNRGESVLVSQRYGVAAKRIPSFLGGGDKKYTVAGLWHTDCEAEKERAENERLYYVAMTRARDKLFLCSTGIYDREQQEAKESSFAAVMRAVLETGYSGGQPEKKYLAGPDKTPPGERARLARALSPEQLDLPLTSPAKLGRLSASAYAMLEWCGNAYRVAYRQGRNLQWALKEAEAEGGADFGSLAHWVLERWDFREASLGALLPSGDGDMYSSMLRILPIYLRDTFGRTVARAALREMLQLYARSSAGLAFAELAADGRLRREVPFRLLDGGLVLTGSMDVLWEERGCLHIRDWKTAAEETAPDEYYSAQLDFYAYAAARFRTAKKLEPLNVAVALNYLRSGAQMAPVRNLQEECIEKIGAGIHAAAERALSGSFSAETARCPICPWKNDCRKTAHSKQ